MSSSIALFCLLHPASKEKKERILSLLSSARSYYTSSASKCTTWAYFLPTSRPNSEQDLVTNNNNNDLLIGGFEIYTEKSALSTQSESDMFKQFHTKIQNEQLYDDKGEELVGWYPSRGFLVRNDNRVSKQGNDDGATGAALLFDEPKVEVLVVTIKVVCTRGNRDRVLDRLGAHAKVTHQNEPGCPTYYILTRPKGPEEILVVKRFDGPKAYENHVGSTQYGELINSIQDLTTPSKTETQEWNELGNAFVGRPMDGEKMDLSSKL